MHENNFEEKIKASENISIRVDMDKQLIDLYFKDELIALNFYRFTSHESVVSKFARMTQENILVFICQITDEAFPPVTRVIKPVREKANLLRFELMNEFQNILRLIQKVEQKYNLYLSMK